MLTNYYIISDLHLKDSQPKTIKLFQIFLDRISHPGNTLFILGDLFDYWVGDNIVDNAQKETIDFLRDSHNKGLRVYFMHGNRDFLIGKEFAGQAKISIINDPYLLKLKHKNILLMHGDLLCTNDISYQIFRKIIRNIFIKKVYLMLPMKIRKGIAKKIRLKSQQKNDRKKTIDVTLKSIDKYIGKNSIIIHGHTHILGEHREKNYVRYVLGDWFNSGNYIHINQNEDIVVSKFY